MKRIREIKQRNALLSAGGAETPPLIIELLRASVNNGKLTRYLDVSTNEGNYCLSPHIPASTHSSDR